MVPAAADSEHPERTLLRRQAQAALRFLAQTVREMVADGTLTEDEARERFPGYEELAS